MTFSTLTDWQGDTQTLRAYLNQWLQDPRVKDAIYIASPSLMARLPYWHKDPDSKKGRKVEMALTKYLIRMAGRATPFGLFAGITTGVVGNETRLTLNDAGRKRITRIDMLVLQRLKEYLLSHQDLSQKLPIRANPTCYLVADKYRFIETYAGAGQRHYRLSAIEASEAIGFVLEKTKKPQYLTDIVAMMQQVDDELPGEHASEFIKALVAAGLLNYELPMPVTGDNPDVNFVRTLRSAGLTEYADTVEVALEQLRTIDQRFDNDKSAYDAIEQQLKKLPIDIPAANLFQVDYSHQNSDVTLDKNHIHQLTRDLAKLARITPSRKVKFDEFVSAFSNRYEGRAVGIKQLLDDEIGISLSNEKGYDTPLLAGLPMNFRAESSDMTSFSQLDKLLLNKLLKAGPQTEQITLNDEDIAKLQRTDKPNLPPSMAVMFSLYRDSDGNPIFHTGGTNGPSCSRILGRFAHLDETLQQNIKQELEWEQSQYPDALLVEIVHLPQGRTGNIIARPVLRQHELPFLADSAVADEFQIDIDDLLVYYDYGVIRLWSKSLNKEIVPRMSCAHNYSGRGLGIYRFLASVQEQKWDMPRFGKDNLFRDLDYCPRIRLGSLILSPRRWKIDFEQVKSLAETNDLEFAQKAAAFRQHYRLPRFISYAVGDNTLSIALDNPLMVRAWFGELKKARSIFVEELLSTQFDSIGQHHQEFVLPLRADNPQKSRKPRLLSFYQGIQYDFQPGSRWLTLKIFGGRSGIEKLLVNQIQQLVGQFTSHKDIDNWFFIRFGDPDWHLRLRFEGNTELLYGELLPAIHRLLEPQLQSGAISKIMLEPYAREVSRYGGSHAIALAEQIFSADSHCCLDLCRLLDGQSQTLRWQLIVWGCWRYMVDLGLDEQQIGQTILSLRQGYGREFNESADLRKAMGVRYREFLPLFESLVEGKLEANSPFALAATIFEQRAKRLKPLGESLMSLERDGLLSQTVERIVCSLLHMFTNRMCVSYGREQELVFYDMLFRYQQHRVQLAKRQGNHDD